MCCRRCCRCCAALETPLAVVILLLSCDLVTAWGAGMTIRFFPLFFANELGLSPVRVSLIYLASPLAVALCSLFAQQLSRGMGRVLAVFSVHLIGAGLLLACSVAPP